MGRSGLAGAAFFIGGLKNKKEDADRHKRVGYAQNYRLGPVQARRSSFGAGFADEFSKPA